jgi:hypothetical protein
MFPLIKDGSSITNVSTGRVKLIAKMLFLCWLSTKISENPIYRKYIIINRKLLDNESKIIFKMVNITLSVAFKVYIVLLL